MNIDKDSDKMHVLVGIIWVESHQSLIGAIFSEQIRELGYHYQTTVMPTKSDSDVYFV